MMWIAHLRRFALYAVGLTGVLYVLNMLRGGAPGEDLIIRALVGGVIGATVLTVYMELRSRIKSAIEQATTEKTS